MNLFAFKARHSSALPVFFLAAYLFCAQSSAFATEPPALPEIYPAKLNGETKIVELPSVCYDVVAAGNGRYLILWLQDDRKLLVFDVCEARVVKEIAVPFKEISIAGGGDSFFVYLVEQKVLQRYDLTNFERHRMPQFPEELQIKYIAMGAASSGPLYGLGRGFFAFDAKTVARIDRELPFSENYDHSELPPLVRVSGLGRTIVINRRGRTGTILTCDMTHPIARFRGILSHGGSGAPSFDGRTVYAGQNVASSFGNIWYSYTDPVDPLNRSSTLAPSVHGAWIVRIQREWLDYSKRTADGRAQIQHSPPSLHHGENPLPIIQFDNVELWMDFRRSDLPPLPLDRRIWPIPLAQTMVVIPRSCRELQLHPVDYEKLTQAFAERTAAWLIDSVPPRSAKAGTAWEYRIRMFGNREGIEFELLSGPEGMQVNGEGVVTWDIPADAPEAEHGVVISLSDSTGREEFHSFSVGVGSFDLAPFPEPASPAADDDADTSRAAAPRRNFSAEEPPPEIEISAPNLPEEGLTLTFDEPAYDCALGGGGRYLALYFRLRAEIDVFDVSRGKIIYTVPVHNTLAQLAASLDKLVVVLPKSRVVMRFDLATGERECVKRLPGDWPIMWTQTGSASRGPLFTAHFSQGSPCLPAVMYDLERFERVRFAGDDELIYNSYSDPYFRTLADKIFVFRNGRILITPQGQYHSPRVWTLADGALREIHNTPRRPIPRTYDLSCPVSFEELPFLHQCDVFHHRVTDETRRILSPAQGAFYLTYRFSQNDGAADFQIHVMGEDRPLAEARHLAVPNGNFAKADFERLPPQRRMFFIPAAKVMLSLSMPANELCVHKLDVQELIKDSPIDFLVVCSRPPTEVLRGENYHYQLETLSSAGGVSYELLQSPRGMTLSPEGELLWKRPRRGLETDENVKIRVTDASGLERTHEFRIQIIEPPDPPEPEEPLPMDRDADGENEHPLRTWVDSTGNHRIRGVFLEMREENKVRIRKDNGALVEVPLEKLSEADRDYVRRQLELREREEN